MTRTWFTFASVFLFFSLDFARAEAVDEFVFILRAKGNPYWNTIAQGIRETAEKAGVRPSVYLTQSESSAEEQLNTCYAAIEKRPKVLSIAAANSEVGILCLKRAASRQIATGDIDATIDPKAAEAAGLTLSFSVGSDNFAIGATAARYLAKLPGLARSEVVVLQGAPGSINGRLRSDGFTQTLKAIAPTMKVTAEIPADWDRMKAMQITSDLLQRSPDLKVISAANDMMALGAVQAIKTSGRPQSLIVLGVDGTADARSAILAGELRATVAQLPFLVGKRVLELSKEVSEGKAVPSKEVTDTPVLDKAVLEDKNSSQLLYVR